MIILRRISSCLYKRKLRKKLKNVLSPDRYKTWGEIYDNLPKNSKEPTYEEVISQLDYLANKNVAKRAGVYYMLRTNKTLSDTVIEYIDAAERRKAEAEGLKAEKNMSSE
jgi:hypothetical protein